MLFIYTTIAALAWGALAFGSNYPWAYWPLTVVAAAGGAGLAWTSRGAAPVLTLRALGLVAAAVLLQLVPLPRPVLAALSPSAPAVLERYDLSFALGSSAHPLSIRPAGTVAALCLLIAFTLVAAGVARIRSRAVVRTLAGAVVVLGGILAIVGIVQRATFEGRIYGFWAPVNERFAPFGPFVNKNHFAGWMLMATPLAYGVLAAAVHRHAAASSLRDRVLWLATPDASRSFMTAFTTVLMGLALVLTMSRSGIIAFGLAILLSVAVTVRHGSWSRRAVLGMYVAGLCALIVSWVGVDLIAERFTQEDVGSLSGRLPIWRDTVGMAREFWLTGTGLNTYGTASLFYQTARPLEHVREAHNDYLQLAAEGGLLLGIPIAIAVAAFAREVRARFLTSPPATYWIRIGAVTGIAAMAIQSLAEFSLQMPGNAMLFAVLCGIALHDGSTSA